jgi:glycosyltransferase involved in cell wall biosynthesis
MFQPSLYEGWSTTIEEAIYLGTPIVASDLQVHKEQLEGIDNALICVNNEDSYIQAMFSPPGKLIEIERAKHCSERWNRFKSDLEGTLINGFDLLDR